MDFLNTNLQEFRSALRNGEKGKGLALAEAFVKLSGPIPHFSISKKTDSYCQGKQHRSRFHLILFCFLAPETKVSLLPTWQSQVALAESSARTKAAAVQTFPETSDLVLFHDVHLTKAFAYLKLAPYLLRNTNNAFF